MRKGGEESEGEGGGWPRFLRGLCRRADRARGCGDKAGDAPVDPSIRDSLLAALHEIEAAYESGGRAGTLRTGFSGFDRLTGGARPGELVVVASLPGMGKTVLAVNVATHVATEQGAGVAVFSLEGSRRELTQRILCAESGVSLSRVRCGGISPERDFPRLQEAAEHLAGAPIVLEDPGRLTVGELEKRVHQLAKHRDTRLVIIDSFDLLCDDASDEEEQAKLARELKRCARESGVVMLVMAHVEPVPGRERRGLRGGKRPEAVVTRGLERHADVMALLWRQDLLEQRVEDYDPDFSQASLVVAKNRHGALGEVPLLFRKGVPRFENRALERRGTGLA